MQDNNLEFIKTFGYEVIQELNKFKKMILKYMLNKFKKKKITQAELYDHLCCLYCLL